MKKIYDSNFKKFKEAAKEMFDKGLYDHDSNSIPAEDVRAYVKEKEKEKEKENEEETE